MKNQKNISVGFLDMLTSFLVATIVIMLIFSYSLNKSGDIAEGPKDYLFYQLKIDRRHSHQIQLKFFINPSGSNDWVEIVTDDRTGEMILADELFLKFGGNTASVNENFYAWGPVYEYDPAGTLNSNVAVFNIYGVGELLEGDTWKVRVLYFNNKLLDETSHQRITSSEIQTIARQKILFRHFGNSRKRTEPESDTTYLSMGQFADFVLPYYETNVQP